MNLKLKSKFVDYSNYLIKKGTYRISTNSFPRIYSFEFGNCRKFKYVVRNAGGGGAGGHVPPQVLGHQLTLFEPRGAD